MTEVKDYHESTKDTKNTKIIFDDLSSRIISAAIEVHKKLGPGFLESIYQKALPIELEKEGLKYEAQKEIEIYYNDKEVGVHRLDLVVGGEIIVELKTVDDFCVEHLAQVISYLKATGLKIGLLSNFSKPKLQIKRIVN